MNFGIQKIIPQVISRYNEDVSWAPIYLGGHIPYEVCQKGDPILAKSPDILPDFYVSPNKGHEAACYLSAIIKHYQNLPDQIAFVHGSRSSWHEADNVFNLLSYQWERRLPYASLTTTFEARVCLNSTQCSDQLDQGRYTKQVWDNLLSDLLNMTTQGAIRSSCCAQFVVTKESILEHPLGTYTRLLRFLEETDMPNYDSSRVLEYLWHILFGMPASFIDLPICERFHCNTDGEWIIPRSRISSNSNKSSSSKRTTTATTTTNNNN